MKKLDLFLQILKRFFDEPEYCVVADFLKNFDEPELWDVTVFNEDKPLVNAIFAFPPAGFVKVSHN